MRGEFHAVHRTIAADIGPADIQADVFLAANHQGADQAISLGVDGRIDERQMGTDALLIRMHLSVSHHLKEIFAIAAIVAGGELRAFPFGVSHDHFTAGVRGRSDDEVRLHPTNGVIRLMKY